MEKAVSGSGIACLMQRKLRRQPKKINLFGCRLFMILRVNKMEGRENRVLKDSGKSKHHKMRTAKMLRAGNSEAMESKGPDKKKSARKNAMQGGKRKARKGRDFKFLFVGDRQAEFRDG